jgi:alkylhydroperoxidase/carboxymuconolactone decarboxylase family protein YurZ
MAEKSWIELLAEYSPELAELNRQDGAFLESDTALPAWVKLLMAMQIDAVFNHPGGVRYYGRRARELGASPQQVAEAIQVLRMFAGRPAMVTGAEGLREET